MDNCGHVRMDRYWNFVAVPTFISTMLFGMYVLFTTDEVQFMSKLEVQDTIAQIKEDKIAKATSSSKSASSEV
jgi:PDZ domain-containing secreted protein